MPTRRYAFSDRCAAERAPRQSASGRHRLRLPVTLGNDANLAALAEHRHGAGRGARHLLYLMTGHRGIGGGLVVDGQLHTGSAGYALEVGHLTVNPGGRPCRCGNSGCLDVEADPAALLAAAGRDQRSAPTTSSPPPVR
jgi:predicted NBD/HSP70 family sugar kinase